MIKSMTGYGKVERDVASGRLIVEIRAVNHRYGEVTVKVPRALLALEHVLRRQVSGRLKRGKIEVFVKLESTAGVAGQPVLNIPLAKAYHKVFVSLKEALGLADPITLSLIASQKDVLAGGDEELNNETLLAELVDAVNGAVDSLESMREREGAALLSDINQRLEFLGAHMSAVAERAPEVVTEGSARLKDRVVQLLAGQTLDESRIAQEIAILADRCDITEELVRFRSHMQQFSAALKSGDPVGRTLDFLLQEFNREVNTIGSKANDACIASHVVALKAEMEKIREQVQNIE